MKKKELFDNNNIKLSETDKINALLERKGLYKESVGFPLASLQFELTSNCNLSCKHCYNNSGRGKNEADEMTVERWIEFSKYIVKHGGVFECIISGGEPFLLGDSLFEIMDILHDDGTIFMLLTNGFFINEKNVYRLKKYNYHWLQISIDGVDSDYHDSFRGRKGSWDKAVLSAKLVSQNGIPLKIAHCVTPYNIDNIDKMCDFAYSLGAEEIIVGELCFSGAVVKHPDLLLSEIHRKILKDKVKENAEKYTGKMIVKTSNSIKKGLEKHREIPMSSAVIRPNGDIRIDGMAPFVIGNVIKDDFEEKWKEKIKSCWQDSRVTQYIDGFDKDDRNYNYLNHIDEDIYL